MTDLQGLLPVFSAECKCWEIKKVKKQVMSSVLTLAKSPPSPLSGIQRGRPVLTRTTNEVLSDEFRDDDSYRREEFSDYQPFGNFSYPRQMKLMIDGSLAVKLSVVSLVESVFDESSFVPPPGATPRRVCENVVHPIPLKKPDPDYPDRSAAENRLVEPSRFHDRGRRSAMCSFWEVLAMRWIA